MNFYGYISKLSKGEKMRIALTVVLVLSLAAFCTGCQAFMLVPDRSKLPDVKPPKSSLDTYVEDRMLDFVDWFQIPFTMRFHMGPGILLNGRLTKFAQVGCGFFEGETLGFKGRELGYWREKREELGVSIFYITKTSKDVLVGNRFLFEAMRKAEPEAVGDLDIFRDDDRDKWDCGLTVHLLFVGFDWDFFRTREFFDFWVGLTTLDMQKDDIKNRLRKGEAASAGFAGAPGTLTTETIPGPPSMPPVPQY